MVSPALRSQARQVYRELHYLGKNYPDPAYPIHKRLHACFGSYIGKSDEEVEQGIKKAEFIKKELEALYFLKKYRSMKQRYYDS